MMKFLSGLMILSNTIKVLDDYPTH